MGNSTTKENGKNHSDDRLDASWKLLGLNPENLGIGKDELIVLGCGVYQGKSRLVEHIQERARNNCSGMLTINKPSEIIVDDYHDETQYRLQLQEDIAESKGEDDE